jgi:hypothetical protein
MRTRISLAVGFIFIFYSLAVAQPATPKKEDPQKRNEIASARLVWAAPVGVVDRFYVLVFFTDPVAESEKSTLKNKVGLSYPKSGSVVPPMAIKSAELELGSDNKTIEIDLDFANKAAAPGPDDDQIQVEFRGLRFGDAPAKNVKAVGKVYNEQTLPAFAADLQKGLKDAVASTKTSDEKNIFAGLNVTIPSGAGTEKTGSGELHINKTLLSPSFGGAFLADSIVFGLNLNKASETSSDPRHLDLGFTYRKTFLRIKDQQVNAIKDVVFASSDTPITHQQEAAASQAISSLQHDFVRAFVWDNAFRFEGDVRGTAIGNVSNLVYDTQLNMVSVTRALAGRNSFWNLRLVPAGAEVGYNLSNADNTSLEKQSLTRLKGGATFTMFYEAASENQALSRIEFEAKGVTRYLFRNESAFDDTTKKAILVDKGTKYWVESNLKFLMGPKIQNGRAGFRVGFSRGFLPPVYAFTKAFTVSLIYESTDDNTAKELKLIK